MSAGAFEDGKYEQNGAAYIWPCRVQPETKGLTLNAVANAYPAAAVAADLPTMEISRRGNRGFGVIPRTVTIELTADGTAETGDYLGEGTQFTIPVFTESAYNSYGKGQTGTYLGIACKYIAKTGEKVR
jgi:hypothetical protein